MAQAAQAQQAQTQEKPEQSQGYGTIHSDRRYVRGPEVVGYALFDMSTKIRQNADEEWTDRILDISKGQQALWRPLSVIWDIINDLFVAAWVDKTRTRFGKFRPYLIAYPVYGIPVAAFLFFLPYIFWGTSSTFALKIAAWLLVGMFNDLTGTIGDIARTGMMANITPNPKERLGLITKAKFAEMCGADFPGQLFKILRDIISRKVTNSILTNIQASLQMRTLYMTFGIGTLAIAGAISLYFALVTKERVFGAETHREKPPSIKESLNALRQNRPLLMLTIADILDGLTIKSQKGNYEKSILNFTNFGTIYGIPGSPVSYISFSYVGKLRQRFSTKFLWLLGNYINAPIYVLIYFFGMIKIKDPARIAKMKVTNPAWKKPGVARNFMDLWPMMAAFGIENTITMSMYGVNKVVPNELRNECIDYGEWKSGIRSEAMTGALRGMPYKITNMIGSSITDAILQYIGFKTGPENYLKQSEKTSVWVFTLATLMPALMRLVSLVPKLMFNISQKDREVMYVELAERRAVAAAAVEEIRAAQAEGAN